MVVRLAHSGDAKLHFLVPTRFGYALYRRAWAVCGHKQHNPPCLWRASIREVMFSLCVIPSLTDYGNFKFDEWSILAMAGS